MARRIFPSKEKDLRVKENSRPIEPHSMWETEIKAFCNE